MDEWCETDVEFRLGLEGIVACVTKHTIMSGQRNVWIMRLTVLSLDLNQRKTESSQKRREDKKGRCTDALVCSKWRLIWVLLFEVSLWLNLLFK